MKTICIIITCFLPFFVKAQKCNLTLYRPDNTPLEFSIRNNNKILFSSDKFGKINIPDISIYNNWSIELYLKDEKQYKAYTSNWYFKQGRNTMDSCLKYQQTGLLKVCPKTDNVYYVRRKIARYDGN